MFGSNFVKNCSNDTKIIELSWEEPIKGSYKTKLTKLNRKGLSELSLQIKDFTIKESRYNNIVDIYDKFVNIWVKDDIEIDKSKSSTVNSSKNKPYS